MLSGPFAAHLSTLGYESILYDSRAHGQSEGIYCTYGFYEKKDVHRIVQRVRTDYGNIKIGLWGKSMGGAVSIQSMAQNSMIDFAIIESAFRGVQNNSQGLSKTDHGR